MGSEGGIAVSKKLDELEAALRDYYGAINEIKMGLKTKIPEKPDALVSYERCQALGLPLVAGGVIDQPHIWLQELAVIIGQQAFWKALDEKQRQSDAPK